MRLTFSKSSLNVPMCSKCKENQYILHVLLCAGSMIVSWFRWRDFCGSVIEIATWYSALLGYRGVMLEELCRKMVGSVEWRVLDCVVVWFQVLSWGFFPCIGVCLSLAWYAVGSWAVCC